MRRPLLNDHPAQQLLWLLLGLLFGLIIGTAAQALMLLSGGNPRLMLMQAVSQVLMFLLPAAVVMWGSLRMRPARSTGWAILLGTAAFLLLVPCLDVITQWNKAWPLPHSAASLSAEEMLEGWLLRPSGRALAENLTVVALVPALCEELFFRCGLQQILRRWWRSDTLAIVVTALIFSLAHGDLFGLVPRFIMGLVLGLLFLRTGSALVNICAHCANNALVVVCYWLHARGTLTTNIADQGITLPWSTTLLLTLAGLTLLALVCRHPKFSNSAPTTA